MDQSSLLFLMQYGNKKHFGVAVCAVTHDTAHELCRAEFLRVKLQIRDESKIIFFWALCPHLILTINLNRKRKTQLM